MIQAALSHMELLLAPGAGPSLVAARRAAEALGRQLAEEWGTATLADVGRFQARLDALDPRLLAARKQVWFSGGQHFICLIIEILSGGNDLFLH